jgi:hypothetical protein
VFDDRRPRARRRRSCPSPSFGRWPSRPFVCPPGLRRYLFW